MIEVLVLCLFDPEISRDAAELCISIENMYNNGLPTYDQGFNGGMGVSLFSRFFPKKLIQIIFNEAYIRNSGVEVHKILNSDSEIPELKEEIDYIWTSAMRVCLIKALKTYINTKLEALYAKGNVKVVE